MKTYTKEELANILNLHKMWLNGEKIGVRADLRNADLSNAYLSNANLCYADLSDADLSNADLSDANLCYADLSDVDLSNANLSDADLSNANLSYADLSNANLCYANLSNANLSYADLRNADLSNIKTNYMTIGIELACPEEGSFVGWKIIASVFGRLLIKLEVPAEAKRSSATTRKCRCEFAKVLEITKVKTGEKLKEYDHYAYSLNTLYKVGEIVYPDSFDPDRWNECSHGIHLFTNKNDALTYN